MLLFKQYYLGCLSPASYLVGDRRTGRAVVVDPQRDIACYLADAAAEGVVIERVIETHVHAGFLSGHLEPAAATGARIAFGAAAQVEFAIDQLEDGARLSLGEVELEIRHTPGHTPESICIVIRAGDPEPFGVLTGDAVADTAQIVDVRGLGEVTLLGDAIHDMTPMAGVGTNTALRDADLLRRNLIAVGPTSPRRSLNLVPPLKRRMLES